MSARLLRWAAAIMLVLGIGHLLVSVLLDGPRMSGWLLDGLWATVPLIPEHTAEEQATVAAFWGGFASFAVPLILLGCLVWHLAGRRVGVPAWVGWGLSAWCAFGGIVLVPSPFLVGVVPGVLIVLAARRDREPVASATSVAPRRRGGLEAPGGREAFPPPVRTLFTSPCAPNGHTVIAKLLGSSLLAERTGADVPRVLNPGRST